MNLESFASISKRRAKIFDEMLPSSHHNRECIALSIWGKTLGIVRTEGISNSDYRELLIDAVRKLCLEKPLEQRAIEAINSNKKHL